MILLSELGVRNNKNIENIPGLENALNYKFVQREYIFEALMHPSVRGQTGKSYERLEFVGDAILGMVIGTLLFRKYPDYTEGFLSKAKSSLVKEDTLAELGMKIGLNECMVTSLEFHKKGDCHSLASVADCFEAVIAAVFFDGGLAAVQGVVEHVYGDWLNEQEISNRHNDYKTMLQEISQAKFKFTPQYFSFRSGGTENEPIFASQVKICGLILGVGEGGSKKQAEKAAAQQAIENVNK